MRVLFLSKLLLVSNVLLREVARSFELGLFVCFWKTNIHKSNVCLFLKKKVQRSLTTNYRKKLHMCFVSRGLVVKQKRNYFWNMAFFFFNFKIFSKSKLVLKTSNAQMFLEKYCSQFDKIKRYRWLEDSSWGLVVGFKSVNNC